MDDTDLKSKLKEEAEFRNNVTTKAKEAARFNPPAELQASVPSTTWANNAVTKDSIEKALKDVQANAAKLTPKIANEMTGYLKDLQDKVALYDSAHAKIQIAMVKAAASNAEAVKKQREHAVAFLAAHLTASTLSPVYKAQAQTNDFNNYVSPEIGIAVAHPFITNSDTTLLPYTAINIYFQPVDRELALAQLVNPVAQRFSLSFGLSLAKELKVSRVDLSPTVAGAFGIVGLGYRILPFARVAGLLVFANATPSGGLSSESKLITAGALAVSGDIDVITFLGSNLKH